MSRILSLVILLFFSIHCLAQSTADSHFGYAYLTYKYTSDPIYYQVIDSLNLVWEHPKMGPFTWENIESVKGVYDFTTIDSYIQNAQNHGKQLVPIIWPFATHDQAPYLDSSWYVSSSGFKDELIESRYKPYDWYAYKEFVKKLVERYDGDGLDDYSGLTIIINHWEVANEPEFYDWTGAGAHQFFMGDSSDYYQLLQNTHSAIKSADPNAYVLNGGAATGYNSGDYWKNLFPLAINNFMDIANYHCITPDISVDDDLRAEKWRSNIMKGITMDETWITEWTMANSTSGDTLDGDVAAKEIIKQYVKAFHHGVDKIFYGELFFVDGMIESAYESALVHMDQFTSPSVVSYRPAFYAMKTMIEQLDYFSAVDSISGKENQFKFVVNSDTVWVLWGSEGVPAELPEQIQVVDYLGNLSYLPSSSLTLTGSPIFVRKNTITNQQNGELAAQINIYPNPVSDLLTINNMTNSSSIDIYNSIGVLVIERSDCESNEVINVGKLSPGVYELVIRKDSNVCLSRKFVKL